MSALCDPLLQVTFTCPECGMQFDKTDNDFDNCLMTVIKTHNELVNHIVDNHWLKEDKNE